MQKIIISIFCIFIFLYCSTAQKKLTEKGTECIHDKKYEYLLCIEDRVQHSVYMNEKPSDEGLKYILSDCCKYVSALFEAKNSISVQETSIYNRRK